MRPKNSHYSHAPVPFQFYKYDLYSIQTVTDLCAFCLNSEISLIRYFFLKSFCQEMHVPLESKFKWKYRLSQVIVHGCSSSVSRSLMELCCGPSYVPRGLMCHVQLSQASLDLLSWKSSGFLRQVLYLFCSSLYFPLKNIC